MFTKKKERNLQQQTFGDYTITQDRSDSCEGYEDAEIVYTEDEFKEGHESIVGYFSWLNEPLRTFLETDGNDTAGLEDAGRKNGWTLIPNLIFAIVSLITTIVFLFYFFCMGLCACLCCCCDDELEKDLADKPTDTEAKRRKKARLRRKREKKIKKLKSKGCTACIVITSLALVLAISVMGIIWSVYMFSAASGVRKTDCASSFFFSEIRLGVSTSELTFIGLAGIKSIFQTLRNEVDGISTTLDVTGFENYKPNMDAALAAYKTSFENEEVVACTGASDGQITPDVIAELDQAVEPIEIEFTALGDILESIKTTAETSNELAGPAVDDFKASLDSFIQSMTDAENSIVDFQTTYNDAVNAETNVSYVRSGAWVIMVGTLGLMIFYILLMICSLNAKCTGCALCLEALLATLKMLFAFIINILAVVFIVVGIIVVNFCVLSYQAISDRDLAQSVFPEDVYDLLDACLFPDSSGNPFDLLGDDASAIDDLTELESFVDGLKIDFDDAGLEGGVPTTSLAADTIRTELLEKIQTYETYNFISAGANGPRPIVEAANDNLVGCQNDEWQLFADNCSKSPRSTDTDGATDNLATDYCVIVPTVGWTDGADRYAPGNCAQSAAQTFTDLKACIEEHDTLIQNMIDGLSGAADSIDTRAGEAYAALNGIRTDFETIQAALIDTVEFIAETAGSLTTILNCKVMRSSMRTLLGNACYEFTKPFTIQGILLAVIGPFMTVLSFCVCCTYQKSKIADDLDDLKKAKKKDAKKTAGQRQQAYQRPPPQMGYQPQGPSRYNPHGQMAPPPPGYY